MPPMKTTTIFHFFGFNFEYYNNYIEKVKNIDAEEIKKLAENYLKKENLIEVVVGK